MNFVQASTPMNLFKVLVDKVQGKKLMDGDIGHVTWTECEAAVKDDFVPDFSLTYAQPDPAVKGGNVGLNLGGIFNMDTTVTNARIDVLWAGSPLHREDHPLSEVVPANGPFAYTLGWYIPPFAPSGHYEVTITINGTTAGSPTAQPVGCLNADFDL